MRICESIFASLLSKIYLLFLTHQTNVANTITMKPKLKLICEMKIRAILGLCLWMVVFSTSSNTKLFVSAGSGSDASDCPAECSCSSSGVVVDCSNRGLTKIPSPLPRKTVTL